MIKGIINGQGFSVSTPLIVSDTIDYLAAEFIFSDDWNGFDKWAHFAHRSVDCGEEIEVVYDVKLTDDRIDKSEHLNLTPGIWSIYIHGTRIKDGNVAERITTESDSVAVAECGVLEGEPLPLTPMSAAERILAMIGDLDLLETDGRSNVVAAINSLAAKLAGGEEDSDEGGSEAKSGVTFTPTVSADGIISWTNDGGLDNPTPVNIKGPAGTNGKDGQPGADGYTPVKGTDYWTAADKAEMVSDVLASLPTWNGGSY